MKHQYMLSDRSTIVEEYAKAALTGMLANHAIVGDLTTYQIAKRAFDIAEEMLLEYDRRLKRDGLE